MTISGCILQPYVGYSHSCSINQKGLTNWKVLNGKTQLFNGFSEEKSQLCPEDLSMEY